VLRLRANLNYFLALVLVGSTIVIGWVAPRINFLFVHPGRIDPIYYNINYIAVALVGCLVLAVWWIKKTILPTPASSKARLVQRIGSVAMTIGNGAIALALIVSLIGVAINHQFGLVVGFIFAAAFMLAFPLDIVGIICVELSRLLDRFQSSQPQE
jgi:hypothetical protein